MKKRLFWIVSASVIFLIIAFLFWNAFNDAGSHMTMVEKDIVSQLVSPEGTGALKVIILYFTTFLFLPTLFFMSIIFYILSWPWQNESLEKVGLIDN